MREETLNILLRISGDASDGENALDDFTRALHRFAGENAEATADVDTDPGLRNLRALHDSLRDIGVTDVEATADVGTADARQNINFLSVQLERLDAKSVDVDVDVDRDGAAGTRLATLLSRTRGASGGFSGLASNIRNTYTVLIGLLIPGLISIAGTLTPLIVVLGRGAIALGALAVAAGGAGLALGTLALGAVARFKEQADIAGTAARALKTAFGGLKDAFTDATSTGADRVFSGLATLLRGLVPDVRALKDDFTVLGTEMGRALRDNVPASQRLVGSFGEMVRASAPLSGPLVRALTALGQIFVNIATAAMPMLVTGARSVADQLERWAAGTGNTERVREVVRGMGQDLSQVGRFAREAGRLLTGVFTALTGPGRQAAADLTELTRKAADWSNSARGQAQIQQFFQNAFFAIKDLGEFIRTYGPAIGAFFVTFGKATTLLMQALNAMSPAVTAAVGAFAGLAVFGRLVWGALQPLITIFGAVGRAIMAVVTYVRAAGGTMAALQIVGRALAFAIGGVALAIGAVPLAIGAAITAVVGLAAHFGVLDNAAKVVATVLQETFNGILSAITIIGQGIVAAVTVTATGIVAAFRAVIGGAGAAGRAVATAVRDGINALRGAIVTAAQTVSTGAVNMVRSYIGAASSAGRSIGEAVRNGISAFVGAVANVARTVGRGAVDAVLGFVGAAARAGRGLADAVGDGIAGMVGAVAGAAARVARGAFDGIRSFAGAFFNVGYNMMMSLARGIASGGSAAINAAVNVARSAWESAKNFLGIGSPSKLFMAMGRDTVAGYAKGMQAEMASVAGNMTAGLALQVDASRAALSPSALSPVSAGTTVVEHHVNNTIQSFHPTDPRTLKEIRRVTAEAFNTDGRPRNPNVGG